MRWFHRSISCARRTLLEALVTPNPTSTTALAGCQLGHFTGRHDRDDGDAVTSSARIQTPKSLSGWVVATGDGHSLCPLNCAVSPRPIEVDGVDGRCHRRGNVLRVTTT